MRLLHTTELRLQEFFDADIPPYAIFSHRWGSDEVSYQDFLAGRKKGGAGFAKISQSCLIAARGKYDAHHGEIARDDWIWIDTCCIDKSSSAELSEAINSMYRWYNQSRICYAFLDDVAEGDNNLETFPNFKSCGWFTRGWTLQELLAPNYVVFLDRNWTDIGNREVFAGSISLITGIAERHLTLSYWGRENYYIRTRATVAEKMSWAAERKTSRLEDEAYCLLGLFGINMPLLYGEGSNAFQRLQMEILRSSDDESIFAWSLGQRLNFKRAGDLRTGYLNAGELHTHDLGTGVLAKSPRSFSFALGQSLMTLGPLAYRRGNARRHFKDLTPVENIHRAPYSITNKGLEFRIPAELATKDSIALPLNCCAFEDGVPKGVYAIGLVRDSLNGFWRRSSIGGEDVVAETTALYCVSQDHLWSRDDLKQSRSEIIYLKL